MHNEYPERPDRYRQRSDPRERYKKLLRLPKIILIIGGVIVVIIILLIVVVLLPLLISLLGAIASGDVANWLQNASKNIQDITKPITDITKTLQGISGEAGN